MKRSKRHIILLTGQQWLGVALLATLFIGTLILLKHRQKPQPTTSAWTTDSVKTNFSIYQAQQDSLHKATYKSKYQRPTIELNMQEFDPNTVDSITLRHLGFKAWQAKNLLTYRAKGGRYQKPEDLKKLYGMTDSMYLALEPYIRIALPPVDSSTINSPIDTIPIDSTRRKYPLKKDTIINIRTADTTLLKLIPNIGSYRARQIVRYRQQLGGFTHIEQILEAPGLEHLPDSILRHFILDSIKIQPLSVNKASVKHLSRHPYLRFEQAKAIYEFRRKHVHLDSIQQLRELEGFDEELLQKLTPYLSFDKNN